MKTIKNHSGRKRKKMDASAHEPNDSRGQIPPSANSITQVSSTDRPAAEESPQVYVSPRLGQSFFSKGPKAYAVLAFVLLFAGCGAYALLSSFAATPSATKTWSTAADWNAGMLSDVAVSGNTVKLPAASTGGSGPVIFNNSGNIITDVSGAKWSVSDGVVYKNNVRAGFSKNVIELAYVNKVIWQENSSNLWWSWNGSNGWNGGSGIKTSPVSNGGTSGSGPAVLSGTVTLTFNASAVSTWNSLTDVATIPSGTTVSTEVRTSSDGSTWSGWTTDPAKAAKSQYLQVQVVLTRTKTSITPTLSSLKLTYTPQSSSNGGGNGGGTGGGTPPPGGHGGGGLTVGSSAPPSGTSAVVDFRSNLNVPALDTYSIGDTLSTYGVPNDYIGNATWKSELAALGPLAWRVPLRDTNGTPTGAGGGGGGTGYVQDIKDIKGVPVVIAAGQGGDDDFNDSQIKALVKYYNDNGGQNGGPVTSWIVGNEPESGSGGGWSGYVNDLPGAINAMESADPNVPIKIAAGTVWDQGDISLLPQIAGDQNISYLTWHAYQGADNNGNNSGQYAGPLYEAEEQQAASIASAHGKLSGIEEFNWNSGCNNNTYPQFNSPVNADFIASVIGNILAGGGAHAYMYADSNGCGTLAAAGNNNKPEYTQLPAYWALGMWTGMNGKFDRFGSNLVDTKVNNVDVQNANGKENAGLQHEVELYATNNGKILAINKNSTTYETISIGVGGLTNGKYNVWRSNGNAGTAGTPTEVTTGASFSGSTISSISLPPNSISSIDVSN